MNICSPIWYMNPVDIPHIDRDRHVLARVRDHQLHNNADRYSVDILPMGMIFNGDFEYHMEENVHCMENGYHAECVEDYEYELCSPGGYTTMVANTFDCFSDRVYFGAMDAAQFYLHRFDDETRTPHKFIFTNHKIFKDRCSP